MPRLQGSNQWALTKCWQIHTHPWYHRLHDHSWKSCQVWAYQAYFAILGSNLGLLLDENTNWTICWRARACRCYQLLTKKFSASNCRLWPLCLSAESRWDQDSYSKQHTSSLPSPCCLLASWQCWRRRSSALSIDCAKSLLIPYIVRAARYLWHHLYSHTTVPSIHIPHPTS